MVRSGATLSLNIPYRKNATSITSSPEHLLHFERTRTLVAGISAKGYRCRMIGVLPARNSRICLARVERPSLSSFVTVTMSPGAAISFASWRPIGTRAVAPTALRFLLPAEVPVLCAHPRYSTAICAPSISQRGRISPIRSGVRSKRPERDFGRRADSVP